MPDYTSNLGLYKPSRNDALALDTTLADNFMNIDSKLGVGLIDERGIKHNSLKERLQVFRNFLDTAVGVNVLEMGATGDGVENDTTAFQKALDVAKTNGAVTVLIPEGTYRMTAELKVYSNTQILCHPNATIVRDHSGYLMMNGNRSTEADPSNYTGYNGRGNIHIVGGIWDGNGVAQPSKASIFHFGHGSNITFTRMTLKDVADSHHVEFNACKNIVVEECNFLGHVGDTNFNEAIQLDLSKSGTTTIGADDNTPCLNVWVQNCYFGPSGTAGSSNIVRAFGSHNSTIGRAHENIHFDNNVVENSSSWAVRAYNWQKVSITNNKLINCGSGINWRTAITGVGTEDPDGNQVGSEIAESGVISGNVIHGGLSSGRAIEIFGEVDTAGKPKGITVAFNTIMMDDSTKTYDAICFSYAENCTCIGNRIYGCKGSSINIKNNSYDITVEGNQIDESGSYGIIVDSASAYINVTGNNIRRSYRSGICFTNNVQACVASGNIVTGVNGVAGDDISYNHVRADGSCDRLSITGNTFRDYGGSYVTTRAIHITSSCLNVLITGNMASGYEMYNGAGGDSLTANNTGTVL